MSKDSSFDIVSDFDHQELINALDQARRDIGAPDSLARLRRNTVETIVRFVTRAEHLAR